MVEELLRKKLFPLFETDLQVAQYRWRSEAVSRLLGGALLGEGCMCAHSTSR